MLIACKCISGVLILSKKPCACTGPAATMQQATRPGAGCLTGPKPAQQSLHIPRSRRTRLVMQAATEQAVQQQQACSPTQFLRPHLLQLAPYTPIEPFEVLSARYGRSPQDIVKLDANENPYGPPPEVREALANMPFPHIYPDPETRRLRKALAEWNDIPMEHLLVSSTSLSGALTPELRSKQQRQQLSSCSIGTILMQLEHARLFQSSIPLQLAKEAGH